MAKNKNLQIVFCGNDKMFDGLFLCIQSILRRTKATIDFYLFTGDLTTIKKDYISLSQTHKNILTKLVKEYSALNTFNVIDCGKKYLSKVGQNKIRMRLWTPYTLFRLFIGDYNFRDKVLYLDVDTLISGDIKSAFNERMQNVELCVCQDTPKLSWNNGKYFNAGTLLINIDYCKKTKLFEKAFQYCIENNPKQLDQTALNACWTNIKLWKNQYRFNCQPDCIPDSSTVIYHFCGKEAKPWNVKRFLKKLHKKNLHIWDEDYKLFVNAKLGY